ncbi:ribonuclease HI family protein [Tessaracoccus massiliensis]|uniref:ribonuclease HI family protein n=1 Tax=Tessaracoccus massiliensis TaxID=1522311 RepID=UPI00058B8887|nr:ribonuclease HI family protein [Tessaracoccus massiliensis]
MIVAAADGSSLSNPGPAGWAWYISDDAWASGGWPHGTNNMGELMAVLDLLQSTAHVDEPLRILCDSQYVINSLTKWLPGWKRKGWKKGDGKPVLNVELMKELDAAMKGRNLHFEWVKGHAGHAMNEAADQRARAAATAFQQGVAFDPGPGFPSAAPKARAQEFAVGSTDPEPDLFSFEADGEGVSTRAGDFVAVRGSTSEPTPGTASPRVKAKLLQLTKELLADEVREDARALGALLHPDFVAHALDGRVIDKAYGAWLPTSQRFEILAVDTYADGVAGVRWRQGDKLERLRFSLWQQTPEGWLMRFAQVTDG